MVALSLLDVAGAELSILLAPLDQGVRNLDGRPGASQAPARLFEALEERGAIPSSAQVESLELANEPGALEADLDQISQSVEQALVGGRKPVVFGGDHGITYAVVRGAARALDEVGVAYLDVHLDLRAYEPVHTSGSSFRRLIGEGLVPPSLVRPLGIQRPSDPGALERSRFDELAAWGRTAGLSWASLDEVRAAPDETVAAALTPGASWCFSFDVDVLDANIAPGVSAPGSPRLTMDEAREALTAAWDRCAVFDVVELSPPLDEADRTLESVVELIAPLLRV